MTARERDPQGASGPPADLTRIAAITHTACLHSGVIQAPCPACLDARIAEALARLAPATPPGAATAGDAREADMREALQRIRTITDDPEVDDGDETEILWKAIAAIHQIADDALIVAPASAERSGAAPEGPATAAGAGEREEVCTTINDRASSAAASDTKVLTTSTAASPPEAATSGVGASAAGRSATPCSPTDAPPAAGPRESSRLEGNAGEQSNPERPTDGGAGHE